ncbi:uncharacterized protein N7515_006941 [Penicillium bovifimosum]|uniref:A to I editase domain-containing protein n=1 Tax=Penicillium bovifimosum TaxID=126998 RepID=A0A9W9GVM5_9EURO|nr:uncharacterized protein N7515_006941 [Penicillium bovifimosum]KAJ5130902.1 hypothetical protein N7515_006941 [Penicillium bovifimosum]
MSAETFAPTLPSRIASLVHAHFEALPTRSKPTTFSDGSREWIPMTGIVAVKGMSLARFFYKIFRFTGACMAEVHCSTSPSSDRRKYSFGKSDLYIRHEWCKMPICISYSTLQRPECRSVLSREKQLSNGGTSVSDNQHAESPFIQRRSIQKYEKGSTSPSNWPPFELRPDIKIYMYCTCAPCGDASMELCMAAQEDATPWEVLRQEGPPSEDGEVSTTETLLDGRAHFSLLGVVRRKPARMDAESTRSKSCSDKLALRQVSSLLSCETSRLVAPAENVYLAGLILPEEEISRVGCDRSFGENGRMKDLKGRAWPVDTDAKKTPVYQFRPFEVLSVPSEEVGALWRFAKPKPVPCPAVSSAQGDALASVANAKKSRPGNVSAVWTVAPSYQGPLEILVDTGSKALPNLCRSKTGLYETIINGVKQGNRASSPGARGASALSRAKLWALFRDVVSASVPHIDQSDSLPVTSLSNAITYQEFKRPSSSEDPLQIRMQAIGDAKVVLKGWVPNAGDEDWGLDVLVDSKKRKI